MSEPPQLAGLAEIPSGFPCCQVKRVCRIERRHVRSKAARSRWERYKIVAGGLRPYCGFSHGRSFSERLRSEPGQETGTSSLGSLRILRIGYGVNGCYVDTMTDDKMKRFEMLAPPEWYDAVDRWRAQQPGIPSRAEAIRRLVEKGLKGQA